jgi:hypothetical protein
MNCVDYFFDCGNAGQISGNNSQYEKRQHLKKKYINTPLKQKC